MVIYLPPKDYKEESQYPKIPLYDSFVDNTPSLSPVIHPSPLHLYCIAISKIS